MTIGLVVQLYEFFACLALISIAFVCVVVHVTLKGDPIRCYGDTFGYPVRGPPLLCCLSVLHVHINGKGRLRAAPFTATLS